MTNCIGRFAILKDDDSGIVYEVCNQYAEWIKDFDVEGHPIHTAVARCILKNDVCPEILVHADIDDIVLLHEKEETSNENR
jgi:hypothetical protein